MVTGGAHGIGAAMLRRFHREKPRALVVADRDLPGGRGGRQGARRPRRRLRRGARGGHRRARRARHARVRADRPLLSNAGIATGGGVEQPDDEWRRIFDINVMAHVWAARALSARDDRARRRLPAQHRVGGGPAHRRSARRPTRSPSTRRSRSPSGSRSPTATRHQGLVLCPQAVRTDDDRRRLNDGGVARVDGMHRARRTSPRRWWPASTPRRS